MKLFLRTFAMVLIALLLSISAVGCGENDDKDDNGNGKIDLSFVGISWEIVTINGEMFTTSFFEEFGNNEPEEDGIESEQEFEFVSNNWVFGDDGSLTGSLAFEVSEKYPGPPASSMTQKLTQTITGIYTADRETLKITTEDIKLDVVVTLEPKEVWAAQIQGKTVEELEADLAAESKSGFTPNPSNYIFNSSIEYTWDVTEDTFTLTDSDNKMVLKKK